MRSHIYICVLAILLHLLPLEAPRRGRIWAPRRSPPAAPVAPARLNCWRWLCLLLLLPAKLFSANYQQINEQKISHIRAALDGSHAAQQDALCTCQHLPKSCVAKVIGRNQRSPWTLGTQLSRQDPSMACNRIRQQSNATNCTVTRGVTKWQLTLGGWNYN